MKQQGLLWKKIQLGDVGAFTEMYKLYYQSLFVHAYRICGDKNLVKDVLHELFLELWVSRQKLEIKSLPDYLHTVVRRKIIKQLSSNSSDILDSTHLNSAAQPSYEDLLIGLQTENEAQQKIQLALKKLSPKQMEVVRMKFFENKSYEQIAKLTETAPRTIYNQIHEALKTLRKYIQLTIILLLNFFLYS